MPIRSLTGALTRVVVSALFAGLFYLARGAVERLGIARYRFGVACDRRAPGCYLASGILL